MLPEAAAEQFEMLCCKGNGPTPHRRLPTATVALCCLVFSAPTETNLSLSALSGAAAFRCAMLMSRAVVRSDDPIAACWLPRLARPQRPHAASPGDFLTHAVLPYVRSSKQQLPWVRARTGCKAPRPPRKSCGEAPFTLTAMTFF